MVRVLVVHDSRLLRSALVALLREESTVEVRAVSWSGAPAAVASSRPDVCVIDADCPGPQRTGGRAEALARSGTALVVLATVTCPRRLWEASTTVAIGSADKDADPRRLLEVIERVADGEGYVAPTLAAAFRRTGQMPLPRGELRVLELAADGATVSQISRKLDLAVGTVRNYRAMLKTCGSAAGGCGGRTFPNDPVMVTE
ncbi:LuxR C-terminal-related transcriptional regulator [Streptomyces sp. NPDC059169]|uniref:LuxR C-terminal-related transcriptional regulator n=1 Tax=unclassified Streptomyces TaxID=2593676 RepID=UPI0036BB1447